jgi:hypothetical protein
MLETVRHLSDLLRVQNRFCSPHDFCLVNSCWLPMLGLRVNGDLDLVVRKSKWEEWFPQAIPDGKSKTLEFLMNKRIRILCEASPYLNLGYCNSIDELIDFHSVDVEGTLFVKPRLYIDYKLRRLRLVEDRIKAEPYFQLRSYLVSRPKALRKKFAKDRGDLKDLYGAFNRSEHRKRFGDRWSDTDWGIDLVSDLVDGTLGGEK